MMSDPYQLDELLTRWAEGSATEADVDQLVRLMESPENRRAVVERWRFDQSVREYFQLSAAADSQVDPEPALQIKPQTRPARNRWFIGGAVGALAATILLTVMLRGLLRTPVEKTNLATTTTRPAVPAPAAMARIIEVSGALELVDPAGASTPATAGQMIHPGQTLRTAGDDSYAAIEYPDKTRLELGSETAVRFPADDTENAGKHIIFAGGSLRADVVPQPADQPMLVEGPQTQVRVRGTRFLLSASSPDATRIDLEEGKVELLKSASAEPIDLTAGNFAVVRTDAAPVIESLPVELREPVQKLGSNTARCVMLRRDGRTIASATARSYTWWEESGKEHSLSLGDGSGGGGRAVLSADQRFLAGLRNDGTILVWDLIQRREVARVGDGGPDWNVAALSPDGGLLAAVDPIYKSCIRLWETQTARELSPIQTDVGSINCLAFSPDGRILAAGTSRGKVHPADSLLRWETAGWAALPPLNGHARSIQTLAFSRDGALMASAGGDGTIRIWDTRTGVCNVIDGVQREVFALAFSPDNATLASGTKDGQLWLWDRQTGDARAWAQVGRKWVHAIDFSPDGRHLVTGAFGVPVMRWDLSSIAVPATQHL